LKKYLDGNLTPRAQQKKDVTVCKMINKEDGRIDWQNETAEQIDRKIRALNPQFKTFTFLANNKRVNILESKGTSVATRPSVFPPGRYELVENKLAIGTKKNILLISELQVEGKKPVTAEEFAQGYGNEGRFC
jgi:methionyl-tRNA formyltransferase